MKMKCLFKSVLRGDVVKPGQILDLTKEECRMDVVKKSFIAVESAPAAEKSAARAPILVAGLTREQVMLKLEQNGCLVKGNLSNKALVELYNQTFSTISEVADKGENVEAPADETTSEAEQEQLDLANS